MVLDDTTLNVLVGGLLAVTLLAGIVAMASKYMTKRVVTVIQDGQVEGSFPTAHDVRQLNAGVNEIKGQVRSLERSQDRVAMQLNNGIKERLDGIVAWQTVHEAKMDDLFALVNRMAGMWDGHERREA